MIVVPQLIALLFAVTSIAAFRASSVAKARRIGTTAAAIAVVFSVVAVIWSPSAVFNDTFLISGWLPEGLLSIAPAVTSMVALVALGLTPVAGHRASTIARMLVLFAVAEAFVAIRHPVVLVLLWVASSAVTFIELRSWASTDESGAAKWHRVFGIYQLTSAVFFTGGALLLWRDQMSHLAMLLVLAGIGIRQGIFPAHSWFPRFVERAPMGLVVAFMAPQLGIYAHLELLTDSGLGFVAHAVAACGAVTAIVAAMLGAVQMRARSALAYLILSQIGLVSFGLESHSEVGKTGALLTWQVLALATSGFAMALAALEARRGPVDLRRPSGNFSQTPRLAVAFIVLGFSSVGFPLTLGFIAEDLLMQGTVDEFPLLSLSMVVATAFNGVTVLRLFLYLFFGRGAVTAKLDLGRRESFILGLLMAALLTFGALPASLLRLEKAVGAGGTTGHSESALVAPHQSGQASP